MFYAIINSLSEVSVKNVFVGTSVGSILSTVVMIAMSI